MGRLEIKSGSVKNETAKKSHEREDKYGNENFGITTCKASRKEKNQVKFFDTPEIIPEQEQLCTIDGLH